MRRRPHGLWPPRLPHRRGVSILEFLCAAAILTAVLAILFPLLTRLAAARSAIQGREAAVRELGNILEVAGSDGALTQSELETVGAALVKERLTTLDDVRFTARAAEVSGENPFERMRPVVLSIAWSEGKGRPQAVELTCWVPTGEGTP